MVRCSGMDMAHYHHPMKNSVLEVWTQNCVHIGLLNNVIKLISRAAALWHRLELEG